MQILIFRQFPANLCLIFRSFCAKSRRTKTKLTRFSKIIHTRKKSSAANSAKTAFCAKPNRKPISFLFTKAIEFGGLIEKNGKPLSEKDQTDEDKNVQKRVAEIEKDIAKRESKTANSDDETAENENSRISIAELLRASNLTNPRRERFRGREVLVFDFEPNPNFDFKNAKSFLKFFGKSAA